MISTEARTRLADEYDKDGMPWFAHAIRNGTSKQFDRSLIVLTRALSEVPKPLTFWQRVKAVFHG